MMRIAIAGAGGFAYLLASEISKGANALLILSTQAHPEFEEDFGCQVAVVDYEDVSQLRYALRGVDLVISTIPGTEQLSLIEGARQARVRHFVPSEFEGSLDRRPANDPLDRGSANANAELDRIEAQSSSHHRMKHTVFACGIFMERFAPEGLGHYNLGSSSGVQLPGEYLVDIEAATAEIIENNESGRPAQICLTSVYDVARFVAAAIELGPRTWPKEFHMRGEAMTVRDLVGACSNFRGVPFTMTTRTVSQARTLADICVEDDDTVRWHYYMRLLQTANGRYYFRDANLNEAIRRSDSLDVQTPLTFREWLQQNWGDQ